MKHLLGLIAAGLGAAATMYYLDPESGAKRRARLTARLIGVPPDAGHPAWDSRQDGSEASDERLRESVVARLGELVSHPGAVRVEVTRCVVRLSGSVLPAERHGLLTQVRDMPGVRRVINALAARNPIPSGVRAREAQPS